MDRNTLLTEQYAETRLIIEELLDDGSDPNALYAIEHHFSTEDFERLEKMAIEAFKLGYEVNDAEELEMEDGMVLLCCDVNTEVKLSAELIDKQVEQLVSLAEKFDINYDGWGTYFEDYQIDEEDVIKEQEEDYDYQDESEKRH